MAAPVRRKTSILGGASAGAGGGGFTTDMDWLLRSPRGCGGPGLGGGGAAAESWLSEAERRSARRMLSWFASERSTCTMAGVPFTLAAAFAASAGDGGAAASATRALSDFDFFPLSEGCAEQARIRSSDTGGISPAAFFTRPKKPGPPHLLM